MVQMRNYMITLYPAEVDRGFLVTKFRITDTHPTKHLEAAGISDLLDQVEHYAMEHGEPCRASVRCLSDRKPPGFDRATQDLFFNLPTRALAS